MNTATYSVSLAKELESVRQNKIEAIRKKIASGKYSVKNNELAQALVPMETGKNRRPDQYH